VFWKSNISAEARIKRRIRELQRNRTISEPDREKLGKLCGASYQLKGLKVCWIHPEHHFYVAGSDRLPQSPENGKYCAHSKEADGPLYEDIMSYIAAIGSTTTDAGRVTSSSSHKLSGTVEATGGELRLEVTANRRC
jgi:hypothetical protein